MEQNWCGGDNGNRDDEVFFSTVHIHNECEIPIPEGYQLIDAQGNIIDTPRVMVLKKKKAYPKSYKECCKVLGIEGSRLIFNSKDITENEENLICKIGRLEHIIVCRNAYWKIAGEELGLGKPWSPTDSDYTTGRYCIFVHRGSIICDTPAQDCILTFPTPEMRDAFHEAFKKEIEICKELL